MRWCLLLLLVGCSEAHADAVEKGCWEQQFGRKPGPGANAPSFDAPIKDCGGCDELRVGPKAAKLHVEVLKRLKKMQDALPDPPIEEPKLWVNSGVRDGPPAKSMHNQGLAVDAVVCGRDSVGTAKLMRKAGFTCVIEYFDAEGKACDMAHADLRNTEFAKGAYAKGGRKARTCPKKAKSKTSDCRNSRKEDWSYR